MEPTKTLDGEPAAAPKFDGEVASPSPSATKEYGGSTARSADPFPVIPGFEIHAEIRSGGMGVVYRATQISLGRQVALKVIRSRECTNQLDAKRFAIEAEVVAKLQHPNIVQVYDVGQTEAGAYITMELLGGANLAEKLEAGPMGYRAGAELLATIARAVDSAHKQGVIHRDLKPANILMTDGGTPKLVDFGVAKKIESSEDLTETGKPIGTPNYMAPEQAAGKKEIGPATDVYALGVILYKFLTGQVPFHGDNLYDTLHAIIHNDPLSPAWYRPDVPRDLETICLKCLRKDPKDRYATAASLAGDLERYLNNQSITAGRTPIYRRASKWTKRRPTLAWALLFFGLLMTGGAALGGWYWDKHHRVRVAYYANYVHRHGEVVGIGLLTETQVRQRPVSYRIRSRGGRIERLDVVDSEGRFTRDDGVIFMQSLEGEPAGQFERSLRESSALDELPPGDPLFRDLGVGLFRSRETSFTFDRDADGRVTCENALDCDGKIVFKLQYTTPSTATFTNAAGYPVTVNASGATFLEFCRDAEGYDEVIRFLDREGKPSFSEYCASAWRFGYDDSHQVNRVAYLDSEGRPFHDSNGIAGYDRVSTPLGGTADLRYFGPDGKPAVHRNGATGYRQEFDEWGRVIRKIFVDRGGKPTRNRNGVATVRRVYNERGVYTRERYFDPVDAPQATNEGVWEARWQFAPDGTTLEQSFHAADGRSLDTADTVAFIQYVSNGDRTRKEVRRLDARRNPRDLENAPALITTHFDAQSRISGYDFRNAAGEPVVGKDGFPSGRMKLNDRGQLEWVDFEDGFGKTWISSSGESGFVAKRDDRGLLIRETYIDVSGKPTLRKRGPITPATRRTNRATTTAV